MHRIWTLVAGMCGIAAVGTAVIAEDHARPTGGRAAASGPVPQTWQGFAARVQFTFETLLAGDDERAQRVRAVFADTSGVPPTVIGHVWITPTGTVQRVDLDGVTGALSMDMRSVLMTGDFGAPPPADMPQPLRLRLRLSIDTSASQP